MSLINQMLRDLERRNDTKAELQQALKLKIAAKSAGKRRVNAWPLALTVLFSAYLWDRYAANASIPQVIAPISADSKSPKAADRVLLELQTARQESSSQMPMQADAQPVPSPAGIAVSVPVVALQPDHPKTVVNSRNKQQPTPPQSPPQVAKKSLKEKAAEKAFSVHASNSLAAKGGAGEAGSERKFRPNPETEPSPALPSPKVAVTEKTSTEAGSAAAFYAQAKRSVSDALRIENLNKALRLEPKHLPARQLLVQALIKTGAAAELAQVADDGLEFFPGNLLFLKARAHLYVQQKNYVLSVNLLERIDSDTVSDAAYLALLAASYQQLQRFPKAMAVYRRLTELQPEKAEYWLGLALAQEKLDQIPAAAESYRQALQKNTLNAQVVSYMNQRLFALTR